MERYVFLLRSSGVKTSRAHLLAVPANAHLGVPAEISRRDCDATRAYSRRPDRLDAAVGHPVSSKIGFSTTFVEEMWARNLGNLLTSPSTPYEFVAALSVWSVIRVGVSMVPVAFAAYFIFGFNLLGLGFALVAFFAVLC